MMESRTFVGKYKSLGIFLGTNVPVSVLIHHLKQSNKQRVQLGGGRVDGGRGVAMGPNRRKDDPASVLDHTISEV